MEDEDSSISMRLEFGILDVGSEIKGPEMGVHLEDYSSLEVKQGCHSLMT